MKRKSFNVVIMLGGALCFCLLAWGAEVRKLTPQDYTEIEQLVAGYSYKIDNCTNSGYDYADQYTADGIFGVSSAWGSAGKIWYRGREELADAGGGGKGGCRNRGAASGAGRVHHITTSFVITPTPTGASGRSTLLSLGNGDGTSPPKIEWQGGYEDTYVKSANGWRFKSRFHVWPDHDWPDTAAEQARLRAAERAAQPPPISASPIPAVPAQAPAAPSTPVMRGDGPPPAAQPFSITRVDPELDAIVSPGAKLEVMASGFGLSEGPVWIREGKSGYLLISGLLDNVLYKITPEKQVSVFLEHAGYTGDDVNHVGTQTRSGRSHVLLIGPSCASLDSQGRLVWCADNDRAIMRMEKDGTRTMLSGGIDGKRFSGPNDIAITSRGDIYLTDNDFGLRDAGKSPDKQLKNSISLIRDGKTTMVLDDKTLGGVPNGIALSPDEKYIYLTAFKKMMRYEVQPDGSLANGTLFTEGPGIGDGMKVDTHGNIFSCSGAGPGIVRITSPAGKLLGYLNMPIYGGEPKRQICATNDAFGGPDGRSLFITACDAIYKIQLKTVGIVPGPKP